MHPHNVAANAAASAIDPLTLALFSIGGVVFTALAGLVGAAIQRRSEHSRWIRERRLEAYLKFLTLLYEQTKKQFEGDRITAETHELRAEAVRLSDEMAAATSAEQKASIQAQQEAVSTKLNELATTTKASLVALRTINEAIVESMTAFVLLGPKAVRAAGLKAGAGNDDVERGLLDLGELEAAMRKALRIRD